MSYLACFPKIQDLKVHYPKSMEKEGREKVIKEVTDDTGKVTDTSTLLLVASLRSFEVTKFQNRTSWNVGFD